MEEASTSVPLTILSRLREMFPGSHVSTCRKMVTDGRVALQGVRVRSVNTPVCQGQVVTVEDAQPQSRLAGAEIIYSDSDILVYAKPPGVITSTTRDETRPTLIAELEKRVDRDVPGSSIYLVHRLDRDASGLLIFARNVKALASLKMQFRRHTITRRYVAWVHGNPAPAGELNDTLVENATGRMLLRPDGKPARLYYRHIKTAGAYHLLEVELYTGRKHQIRVQCAQHGFPVAGDRVYGKADGQKRLLLHALELVINHPHSGHRMAFRSPLPTDFQPRKPSPPALHRPVDRRKKPRK